MALRTTIDLNAPDKTETTDDVTSWPRGFYDRETFVFTQKGTFKSTVTHTVKTWVANTLAACNTARGAYAGTGAVRIIEAHPVVKAYTLEISEDSNPVYSFVPV